MLYELEWQTPHETPQGLTVPEWVETVKGFEAQGWRREGPDRPANALRTAREKLCLMLCWRERCHRAGRCRSLLPLGQRDWMPELSLYLSALCGKPQVYFGPVNPDKMLVLAEIFGPLKTAPPNRYDREYFLRPCKRKWPNLLDGEKAPADAAPPPA